MQPSPIEKSVVLVGAGNAHLQFVKRWRMRPLRGVAVTLVNEATVIPYSAMVPAHIAGDYTWDEITIDLVRLCQSAGVRLVAEKVTALDPASRQVCFAARPPLTYDVLSLGLGSIPASPTASATAPLSLVMRPLARLVQQLDDLDDILQHAPRPFHFAVVGGGASGCELALAIQHRLGRYAGFRMTLLQGNDRLLPQFPARAAWAFQQALHDRGIAVRLKARVVKSEDELSSTRGRRNGALRRCALGHRCVAATSACAIAGWPWTPTASCSWPTRFSRSPTRRCSARATAFRFAPIRSCRRTAFTPSAKEPSCSTTWPSFLHEQPLRPFRPQRLTLNLLNTADGQAILSYGPLAWKSRWARTFKDRIDRRWMAMFTQFATDDAAG